MFSFSQILKTPINVPRKFDLHIGPDRYFAVRSRYHNSIRRTQYCRIGFSVGANALI